MFDSYLLSFPPYSTPLRILNGHIHAFVLKYSKCNVIAPRMKTDFCFGKKKITYEKHQKYATPTSHHYIHLSLYIKTYININRKKSIIHQHEYKHTFTQTHIFTRNARSLPGFCRLRMHSKGTQHGSVPVAFVEFKDAACAGSAMSALQGTFLLSSDRGAIRIEYAKSKMVADAAAAIAQLERSMCFNSIPFTQTFHIFFIQSKKHSILFFLFYSFFVLFLNSCSTPNLPP